MNRLLLDTTFLIDVERAGGGLDAAIDDDDDIAIAAVTVAELQVGVLLAEGTRRAERASFLADLLATVAVVPYDEDVALAHAELLAQVHGQGRPRGAHDLLIAATARDSGRTILSADTSAFSALDGVKARSHR